ncbi:MAG: GxxExxY protein [Bacteroidetes bacterium]|nr:GxxExxY protein [Bacteroidota bacterium]
MTENEIAKIIVDVIYKVHVQLGPGLFESVYETIVAYELANAHGLRVRRQVAIPVIWKNVKQELGFRVDLIIEEKVLVELKCVEALAPVHHKQVLTYLKLTNLKLGLLINFDQHLIKDGIKRIVNKLD